MLARLLIAFAILGALIFGACAPEGEELVQEGSAPSRATEKPSEPVVTPSGPVDTEGLPTLAPSPEPTVEQRPQQVPPTVVSSNPDEVPEELIQQAIADLAERMDATEDQVEVIYAAAVVWNDGSMGCPQPDTVYTQGLVEGYQILLRYQGQLYAYHGNTRMVFLCESALISGPPPKRQLAPELRLVNLAMDDLAQRLGVDRQGIEPQPIIPQMWPDTSLGCPQSGQVYDQVETRGYVIVLTVDEDTYTYHTDLKRVVYCQSR